MSELPCTCGTCVAIERDRANRALPGRDESGKCSQCGSPPEAYHSRLCSHFRGYHCHRCGRNYFGDYCTACPAPWWAYTFEADLPPTTGETP